jgi:hypothetical protein
LEWALDGPVILLDDVVEVFALTDLARQHQLVLACNPSLNHASKGL